MPTAQQILTRAAKGIKHLGRGETLTAQDANDGLDAMNALMIGMNNIGVLAKNGHLSLDLVEDFCGVYVRMFARRWRRVIHIFMMVNVQKTGEGEETIWGGLFWLLDHLEAEGSSGTKLV